MTRLSDNSGIAPPPIWNHNTRRRTRLQRDLEYLAQEHERIGQIDPPFVELIERFRQILVLRSDLTLDMLMDGFRKHMKI
jgi:hypothetical protein